MKFRGAHQLMLLVPRLPRLWTLTRPPTASPSLQKSSYRLLRLIVLLLFFILTLIVAIRLLAHRIHLWLQVWLLHQRFRSFPNLMYRRQRHVFLYRARSTSRFNHPYRHPITGLTIPNWLLAKCID